MGMIGGQGHDRLAALAGADVRRGEPFDLLLRGHVSGSEDRHPDHPRMKPPSEHEIDERPDGNGEEVVPAPAYWNGRRARVGAPLECDAVKYCPGQDRSEQDDRAEIAV